MPKVPDVVAGEPIESVWGNQSIRDRTVQRMTNEADRDASIPTPGNGETVWIEDINQLQIWDGTSWIPAGFGVFLPLSGGVMSGPIDFGGNNARNVAAIYPSAGDPLLISDGTLTVRFRVIEGGSAGIYGQSDPEPKLTVNDAGMGMPALTASSQAGKLPIVDDVSEIIHTADGITFDTDGIKTTRQNQDATVLRNVTFSTELPSGGQPGDIWIRYSPNSANALKVLINRDGSWYGDKT